MLILIAGPFAKLAAYAAIAYGAWTIWKKRKMIRTILLSIAIALAPLTAFAYVECNPKAKCYNN